MKRRRLVWIGLAIAGVVVACVLILKRSGGPVYEGKSAAAWLELYQSGPLAEREDAEEAFRSLGDAAVPYLLGILTRPDPSSSVAVLDRVRARLPGPLKRLLPGPVDQAQRSAANDMLKASRPSAQALLARVRGWLVNPEHPRYLQGLAMLGCLGSSASEGVPFLVQALESSNRLHRACAAQAAAYLGPAAAGAVPALVPAIRDTSTRRRALRALGKIGRKAGAAIPEIEQLLDTRDGVDAALALHQINPEGPGLRVLMDAARDRSRSGVVESLGELGAAATPALDVLLLQFERRTFWLHAMNRWQMARQMAVVDVVHKISPTNRTMIAFLVEGLASADGLYQGLDDALLPPISLERLNLAARLLRFDSGNPRALKVMTDTLRSDAQSSNREFAAYVLRQAGPGARAAIPALEGAVHDKDERVQRSAASALRKIRGPVKGEEKEK